MKEEAPTNSAGGGQIASIGVGEQGEPGYSKKNRPKILRRKKLVNENSDSNITLLNYITNSFYKLANTDNPSQKSMFLLLAAAVMAGNNDSKSAGMAKRLAQLALSKSKGTDNDS